MKVGIVGLGYRMEYLAGLSPTSLRAFAWSATSTRVRRAYPGSGNAASKPGAPTRASRRWRKAEAPDLLMIGSPNHMHLRHLTTALGLGLKVFCEKPVVISEEETLALLRLLNESGGPDRVMVGLVLRYAPLYIDLKDAIAAGSIGTIASIDAGETYRPITALSSCATGGATSASQATSSWKSAAMTLTSTRARSGARAIRVASFGGRKSFLPENEVRHNLDVYHRKPSGLDEHRKGVRQRCRHHRLPDSIVEYATGASMSFHINLNAPDDYRRFCVIGAKGMAEGDFVRNYFRVTDARTGDRLIEKTYTGIENSATTGPTSRWWSALLLT
jgi:predicted dehydrogenase